MNPSPDLIVISKEIICQNISFFRVHPYVRFTDKRNCTYEGLIMALSRKEVLINRLGYTDGSGNLLDKIVTYQHFLESDCNDIGWIQLSKIYIEDLVIVWAMNPCLHPT
jgi:hypothetical protein